MREFVSDMLDEYLTFSLLLWLVLCYTEHESQQETACNLAEDTARFVQKKQ